MAVFVEGLKNILLHLLGDFNRMICKFLELKITVAQHKNHLEKI